MSERNVKNIVQELVDGYGSWFSEENWLGGACGRMTSELYPYEKLFSPVTINRLKIKNRIVMAPMGTLNMCDETGRPGDKMLQYFFARAKGGAGLLTTGLIPVSHGIDPTVTEPEGLSYFPRIDRSRTVMSGWRDLAQGVHACGSRIFIQLTPGMGRVGNPQCLMTMKKLPVSASWNPSYYMSQIPCRPLSGHALKKIIKNTGQAAADAKAFGIDGVYLHGHEGYLLEQMTNPAFNRRRTGRYSDWRQFGIDLVNEIRERTGDRYPIMYRIDLSLALDETYGREMKDTRALRKFTGGRTPEQTLEYIEDLIRAGVDIFDVDLGCYDNWWLPHPPSGMPAGCFLEVSRIVRNYLDEKGIKSNAGMPVPVVAVGKLGYPDVAEKALRENKCDMVMLGRPLLADPDWPLKAYSGRVDEIRPCIGCQEGCINEFVEGGHPQCAVNPITGFEDVKHAHPSPASVRKKVAVVGGGPAGAVFALTAAERGHDVTLYEPGKIGGKLLAASVPEIKFDVENYVDYLQRRIDKASDQGTVRWQREYADPEKLAAGGFDVIVTASGTKDASPRIDGIEKIRTVQAPELLTHPELLGDASKVVVIGGGSTGCETAYWLRTEKKCDVTVIEMLPVLMKGVCTANRGYLLYYMKNSDIKVYNCACVKCFGDNRVEVQVNADKNVPDPFNTWESVLPENVLNPLAPKIGKNMKMETLEADLVVLAMGGRADDSLYEALVKENAAPEIYNTGDSFSAGRVLEAVRGAWALGEKI